VCLAGGQEGFLIATDKPYLISNKATGDQTAAINQFLKDAQKQNKIAYFPGGIYSVTGTVFVPPGSRVQGASWSQIQGSGKFLQYIDNPQVMVKVGNAGDVGTMEIVEMLFSVKGSTAGAILMEWNIKADKQGSGKFLSVAQIQFPITTDCQRSKS